MVTAQLLLSVQEARTSHEHGEKIGNIPMIPTCVHPCEQKLPSWLLC